MSAYDPPSETIGVFNGSLFTSTSDSITQSYADTHYLKYPTSQSATETITSLVVSNDLTSTNDATINGLTVGKGNTSAGATNTAIGYHSLLSTTISAQNNVAIGYNSSNKITSAINNVAVGKDSLFTNVGGNSNIAIGNEALYNTTNAGNVGVGENALRNTSTGTHNVAVGYQAGYAGGVPNTVGSYNTYVGYQAQTNGNNYTNSTAIGANAVIGGSNQIILGTASETVKYNKVAPLYSTIPTFTSADIGYSESITSTVTSIGTTITTLMTSSSLPIGKYLYFLNQVFDTPSSALVIEGRFRIGTAVRQVSRDSVVASGEITLKNSGVIEVVSSTSPSNTLSFQAKTSTGTVSLNIASSDNSNFTIVRIA